jgi:hypothetical protein
VVGPINSYSFDQVRQKRATAFHVRASSDKEKVNLEKSLMWFVMHEDELWGIDGSGNF